MRLEAALVGDLERCMADEIRVSEAVVTASIREAVDGLKNDLRRQIVKAGLGKRLANTWRGQVYPKGQKSLNAAGLVWSKAPQIVRAHDEGVTIRGKAGLFLAIPTPMAPRQVLGKRVTPGTLEQTWGIRLHFVYRRGQPSLLVATLRAGTGVRGGFRAPSQTSRRTGTGLTSVPMFLLVPQVRLRKKLDVAGAAAKWQAALPQIIVHHFQET